MTEQNNTKVTYKSIVENLIKTPFLIYQYDLKYIKCPLCKEKVAFGKGSINHTPTCPYHQAVELLADDSITVDKLVDLGFRERDNINDEFLGYTYNNFDVFFVKKSEKLDKVIYNYEETKVENMTDLRELIRLLG